MTDEIQPTDLSRLAPAEAVPPLHTDFAGRVLSVKEGDTFIYSGVNGDLDERYGHGFYHLDTRYLSHLELELSGRSPILLSSSAERAFMAHIDLTNPELSPEHVPQQSINVRRVRVVLGRLFERIRVKNYNPFPVSLTMALTLGADFADVFEVRGLHATRGHAGPPHLDQSEVVFTYRGVDGVDRRTVVSFSPLPDGTLVDGDRVRVEFRLPLDAHETRLVAMTVEPVVGQDGPPPVEFDQAVHRLRRSYEEWEARCTQIVTDNELFNGLLARGLRDLRALEMTTEAGRVIAAGIPWYVAVFGRDAILTAHQLLPVNPRVARDTLRLLAAHQGTKDDPWRDEEPGKILHEIRRGDLAEAGVIPHSPYYGSVDATPLFVFLFAQLFRWTGDRDLAKELLPNVQAALEWIDRYGDLDGDGFVEYRSRSPRGIANQGWKDSYDAIVHADGRPAPVPIALVEVQGYVYMAKVRVADVFEALGDPDTAERLRREAAELRARFDRAFWMEDHRYFALALDGDKRQVATISSNPGQCLYADILEPERAEHVARRLLQPDLFSGWGIRTLSKTAQSYNPMSYHNGSVWPHDNALIAAGLKRYGFVRATNRVATAVFDTALHADDLRLDELFCGFTRRTPNRPVAYPVACSPQGWAAGAPLLLLQAILGLSARAHENLITINKPHLPPWLNVVELRNLRVGDSSVSLVFRREGEITGFSLVERTGDVRVLMEE
jgi:glycogen debranching enzyme